MRECTGRDGKCIVCRALVDDDTFYSSDFCSIECGYYYSDRIEVRTISGNIFFGYLFVNHVKGV